MKDLNEVLEVIGLRKINSLTKYPSIETYHYLDRGILLKSLSTAGDHRAVEESEKGVFGEEYYITEKIDGTNSRMVFYNGDYLIGSREEIIYANGDRVENDLHRILSVTKSFADDLCNQLAEDFKDKVVVIYGESFGLNITKASQHYSQDRDEGFFRVFDVLVFETDVLEWLVEKQLEFLSGWRERGEQPFLNRDDFVTFTNKYGIERTPLLREEYTLPTDLLGTREWLNQFPTTKVGSNSEGISEGVVVRNFDRTLIRKIRFEDYNRWYKKEYPKLPK